MKVMIIDDSALVLTIVRQQLEQAGFAVITRESALGTAAAVLREQPDVVLVDVMMPALAGDDLVALLRKQPGNTHVAILLFSDKPADTLQVLARQAGADGYVTKGTPAEMLVAQIHACIKSRPTTAQATSPSAGQGKLGVDPFVLFVDRDASLRALCTAVASLGAAGFVHHGHEALEILRGSHPPTCVFVGARLSDMQGEDLWHAAVALDASWRDRVMLLCDAEHPTTHTPLHGPKWVMRPTAAADVEAAMRRS